MTHILRHIPLTILVLGASLMTACSDTDTPSPYDSPETYITFARPGINIDATSGDFSRSRSILATSVDRFKVWGFCVTNNIQGGGKNNNASVEEWNIKSPFFTSGADLGNLNGSDAILTNGSYKYGNDYTPWVTPPAAFANKEALHTFIAATDNGTTTDGKATYTMSASVPSDQKGPKLTITLPATSTSLTTTLDHNKQPDVMIAERFDHGNNDGRVQFSFRHIMTGLKFMFYNHTDETDGDDLIINSVTFSGKFHKEAILDYTTDSPVMSVSDATYSGTFSLLNAPQTITKGSSDYLGADNPTVLLLLPNPNGTLEEDNNNVLGTEKELTINYTFGGTTKDFKLSETLGKNFTLNYLPKANNLHTAHFHFVGNEFIVMFRDESNWENGTEGNSSNITIN